MSFNSATVFCSAGIIQLYMRTTTTINIENRIVFGLDGSAAERSGPDRKVNDFNVTNRE